LFALRKSTTFRVGLTRIVIPLATLAAALVLLCAAAPASAADFAWTGTAARNPEEDNWSIPGNWEGTVPTGSVGRLTFAALPEPPCGQQAHEVLACYLSKNDISGLAVNAISIDDGVPYLLSGNPIRLGKGGLTASPSANDRQGAHVPQLELPIVLTAPQTWSIVGGHGQQLGVDANVSGKSQSLGIRFRDSGFLNMSGDVEVGRVSISGAGGFAGGLSLAGPPGSKSPASLNGADGRPVDVKGASLSAFGPGSTIGPLTMSGGHLQVGQSGPPNGTLTVAGPLTLGSRASLELFIDGGGKVPGTDFSQLSVAGKATLHGAHLRLAGGSSHRGGQSCTGLKAGTSYPLIKARGGLSGRFQGIHDGATIPLQFCSGSAAPSVRIDYRRHAVVARVQR
jgi:hypothetical protein